MTHEVLSGYLWEPTLTHETSITVALGESGIHSFCPAEAAGTDAWCWETIMATNNFRETKLKFSMAYPQIPSSSLDGLIPDRYILLAETSLSMNTFWVNDF